MPVSRFTFCPAGTWTRLYSAPSFGFVYLWSANPPSSLRYQVKSANLPFYFETGVTISNQTAVVIGLPTPYVEVWINPSADGNFMAS